LGNIGSQHAHQQASCRLLTGGRFISNVQITQGDEGVWTYPPTDSVLEDAGVFPIKTYIQRRQNTIFNFVKDRPIYQKCKESEVVSYGKKTLLVGATF
jgi:hypothetical protein